MRNERPRTRGSNRSSTAAALSVVVTLMFISSPANVITVDSGVTPKAMRTLVYPLHDPIVIEGDSDFIPENGVTGGSGTAGDPYMIAGWEVALAYLPGAPGTGIKISNTSSSFVIRDVRVLPALGSSDTGIVIENAQNGMIDKCIIENTVNGIVVRSCKSIAVSGNDLTNAALSVVDSYNVSVTYNLCLNSGIALHNCSNSEVADNTVFMYSAEYPGIAVRFQDCTNCTCAMNLIGTVGGEGFIGSGMAIEDSTACTIEKNRFTTKGIWISGSRIEHYTSHDIGANNTVNGQPIISMKNRNGVTIDGTQFGQLIIINCTRVRLANLVVQDLFSPISLFYVADGMMTECTLFNSTDAMWVEHTSRFRIISNVLVGLSTAWIDSCSEIGFLKNQFISGPGQLMVINTENAIIENNRFADDCGELYLALSRNATITGNILSRSGIRLDGANVDHFTSHTIDTSNQIMGYGPVWYLKDQTGLRCEGTIGQLIMANCSNGSISNMTTGAGYAVQLACSDNITIRGCQFENAHWAVNLHLAENITIEENTFQDCGATFQFWQSRDVRIYHNNFLGMYGLYSAGGIDFLVKNVSWDNGYPSGGNYWEGFPKDDRFRGPAQNISGSDGICDSPVDVGGLGMDRYPLVYPYGYVPPKKPKLGWDENVLWLSAIAAIVAVSGLLSYALFIRGSKQRHDINSDKKD